ncbi:monocarboxylic acid transporter [Kwoniella heveanensis CBS 569]|nr:monocarboxylic acid transporter [Kwoniella heveanensis CBS 569]
MAAPDIELSSFSHQKTARDVFRLQDLALDDVDLDIDLESTRRTSGESTRRHQPRDADINNLSHEAIHVQEAPQNSTEALPPVDGGKKAWLFLLAATSMEILVWGLPFSIGVLHVYWTNEVFHGEGAGTVTLAATLQTGLLYIFCALVGLLFAAFPRRMRTIQIIGLMVGSSSMVAAAFVTKPWHLIITVGCFYPWICAAWFPCATILFEWFHAKRGLASGIMYAGSGGGGTIFPLVLQALLSRFGYKAAMITLGIAYAALGSIALIPIKRRIPLSRYELDGAASGAGGTGNGRRAAKMNWSFLKKRAFVLGVSTILLTSLGNFIPTLWIPSYAEDLGMHKPDGTAVISILNAASALGCPSIGWLSDRLPLRATVLISCTGSALACAFLWGFGTHQATFVIFAIVFGALGCSFTSIWSKIIGYAAKDDPSATALVYAIFTATRGIGNLSSGPVSEALMKFRLANAPGAYGVENYGVLLVYTAVTIIAGGVTGAFFQDR